MLVDAWNCQGVGQPPTIRRLKEFLASCRPSTVFFMETKNKANKLELIRKSIESYAHRCYINPTCISGGLVLWWKEEVDIQIIKGSPNIIHTKCKSQIVDSDWLALFVYADYEANEWFHYGIC